MNTIIWDDSIRNFLQQAGSSNPTPGGGSVAALIAALGGSMTSMVSNLSQGEQFAHIEPQIAEVIEKMSNLTMECEELLDADITAFNKYMDALKLPKNTEEEKLNRKTAIHKARITAIDVPLRLIEVCQIGMLYTHNIVESSNKNLVSDLGIGAILFEAAAQSASLLIEGNLAMLKDFELKRKYSDKRFSLISEISELKSNTLEIIRNRINQ